VVDESNYFVKVCLCQIHYGGRGIRTPGTIPRLKRQGWKYEKKDFGSTSCSLLTPPAGAANGSPATSCATVVKGMLVMTSTSSKASIPAEKIKSLAETAAARLP